MRAHWEMPTAGVTQVKRPQQGEYVPLYRLVGGTGTFPLCLEHFGQIVEHRAAFQLLKFSTDTDLGEPPKDLGTIRRLSFHTHSPNAFPILSKFQITPHINQKQIMCDFISCKFSG